MIKNSLSTLLILFVLSFDLPARAQVVTLDMVEKLALKNSDKLIASQNELESVKSKASSSESLLYPRLSMEGTYRHVSEVPDLTFPTGQKMAFGDNKNYSVGPMISWTLLDFGQSSNLVKSVKIMEESKVNERSWVKRQTLLLSRITYLKCILKTEQIALTRESLKLAQNQYKDILNRSRAGTLSRIDLLSASKEVNSLSLQLMQLESEYKNEIKNLSKIINDETLLSNGASVQFESLSEIENKFVGYKNKKTDDFKVENHPLILSMQKSVESLRHSAESSKSSGYPKLTVFAKTSFDYPDGPKLEQIHQNTIGMNVSIPLYEAGKSTGEYQERFFSFQAMQNKKDDTYKDLKTEYAKTLDQLGILAEKSSIYNKSIKETEERAKLVYSSYLSGKLGFLEVQSANLQLLDSKTQSTLNDIQIIIQLIQIASFLEDN